MNIETVRKCADMAAQMQMAAFGHVTQDVQDLIDELNAPAPVAAEAPVTKPKPKAKTAVE
jgi:hypothetical protein